MNKTESKDWWVGAALFLSAPLIVRLFGRGNYLQDLFTFAIGVIVILAVMKAIDNYDRSPKG